MAAYAPIPLFAESFRVQRALVSTILTRSSISPCLTGCIKDFQRLWNVDEFELLGQFEGSPPASVVGIRHGNTFQLVNKAILDACQITGRRPSKAVREFQGLRESIVNISFISPAISDSSMKHQNWRRAKASLMFAFETAVIIAVSVALALHGELIGSALPACVATTNIILFLLRQWTDPIFGNANALHSDRYLTARGGAALDVHIIADNWNSPRLDVVCGYSSQLHALTNIPVRVNNPVFLRWACRLLAFVLAFQAAALATLTNATGFERWSALIWLGIYCFMLMMKRALHSFGNSDQILENQPATVTMLEPLHFSGRRCALAFISTLPVTHKVDMWTWWDVFMPENARRKEFHAELQRLEGFVKHLPQGHWATEQAELEKFSPSSRLIAEEIEAAHKKPELIAALKAYMEVVYPPEKTGKQV